MNSTNPLHPIKIVFWGVRGSKPSPNKQTVLYGGNTSCVEVRIDNRTVIFDGGTGLAELGHCLIDNLTALNADLNANSKANSNTNSNASLKIEADIFLSHIHWDHIQGIPFFTPMYQGANHFNLYGESKNGSSLQKLIEAQMQPPHFPITMDSMSATRQYHEITTDQTLNLGDGIYISTFAVNHPNGCLAYRLQYRSSSVVYCTDTEPMTGFQAEQFLKFINNADVLIYDSHYTDDEYYGFLDDSPKQGWGHSTWNEAVRISSVANIRQLVLFHHKENRTDSELQLIEEQAKQHFTNTVAAREGMLIEVGGINSEKVVINYS